MRYLLSGIAILACGNDNAHHLADSAVDSPSDATPDGPSEGVVSLQVQNDGPVAGVTVHFQNADGSLVATMQTDATGTASTTMRAGGSVTAVEPLGPDELFTFAGVAIGDQLHIDLANPLQPTTFTVDAPLDTGAAHTFLYTGCGSVDISQGSGSGTGPASVQLFGCGATVDMVVESFDVNFLALQALFQPAVAVSEGAAVTLTNSYKPLVTSTATLASFPTDASGAHYAQGLGTASGFVVDTFANSTGLELVAGAGSASIQLPDIPNAFGSVDISLPAPFSELEVLTWGPYTSTFTLDGSALLAAWTSAPAWDPAQNAVTYTVDATGATPDFDLVQVDFSRATSTPLSWTWHLVAPHATTLALPKIPAGATDFNPAAADSAFVDEVDAAKITGGYATVRAHAFDTNISEDLVTPTPGQLSLQFLEQPELRSAHAARCGADGLGCGLDRLRHRRTAKLARRL